MYLKTIWRKIFFPKWETGCNLVYEMTFRSQLTIEIR